MNRDQLQATINTFWETHIIPVLFEYIKNGKVVGHTDNYIQVRTDGHPELVNTIHKINLAKNKNTFIEGKLL